jgi:hypothetical protein
MNLFIVQLSKILQKLKKKICYYMNKKQNYTVGII